MKKQTFFWKHLVTSSSILTLASACAPTGFTAATPVAADSNKGSGTIEAPTCVPDATDYNVKMNVYAFQMTDSAGINFGFNAVSGLLKAIGLGVQVESGTINSTFELDDPLKPVSFSVAGDATLSKDSFNFDVDLGVVSIGANAAFTTSVNNLTAAALTSALSSAATQVTKLSPTWSTHVTHVNDATHVVVPIGSLAGARAGDSFNIYDYSYVWSGTPCASSLISRAKVSTSPIAVGTITDLDLNTATLELKSVTQTVKLGDELEILTLPSTGKKDKRALKRAIRVSALTQSGPISVEGAGTVDLTMYLQNQIGPMMNSWNFWIVGQ